MVTISWVLGSQKWPGESETIVILEYFLKAMDQTRL